MKNQTKIVLAVLGALAMSACGRNDFNGTYTGYETSTGATTMYGQNVPAQVTLTLKQEDEFVTGTYTSNQNGASQTGQFTASARDADSLTNATLIMSTTVPAANTGTGYQPMPSNYGAMSGGFFTGSLTSASDGRQITGTLNSQGGGMMYYGAGTVGGKTLNLTKSGK